MASKETIVGLDIGSYAVKAVWAVRRGRRLVVKKAETLRLPTDRLDREGVIKQWLDAKGIPGTPCVLGLSGQQSMFQPLLLPPGDPRTVEQAAAMEVIKFNEMASQDMVYGFAPFSLEEDDRRLLLAMARPNLLDEALRFAKEAGLHVVDLIPSPVAFFNALELREETHEGPQLYINCGHATTEVSVGGPRGLIFSRAFAGGGQMFTDAIATARGLSGNQAEHMKTGADFAGLANEELAEALSRTAGMWIGELRSCLSVYESLFPGAGARPGKVLLCGGAARLAGLAELVGEELAIPTEIAAAQPSDPPACKESDFTVAIGLAMAALEIGTSGMSLLPAEIRDELIFRRHKPFWIGAGVAASLILGVSLLGGYRDLRRKEGVLKAQQVSLRHRQKLVADIEALRAQQDRMRRMAQPSTEMMQGMPLLRDLLGLLAEGLGPDDWVSLLADGSSYHLEEETVPGRPAPRVRGQKRLAIDDKPSTRGVDRIVIEGYTGTRDLSTVQGLIEKLLAAPFIESADLLGDDQWAEEDRATRPTGVDARRMTRFVIELKVKQS